MEDLFNMLSSSARLDKSKRKKRKPSSGASSSSGGGGGGRTTSAAEAMRQIKRESSRIRRDDDDEEEESDGGSDDGGGSAGSRDSNDGDDDDHKRKKRPKKQHSARKLEQMHREEVSAFRRRMGIRLSSDNRQEAALGAVPDPISSFRDWRRPAWWKSAGGSEGDEGDEEDEHFARVRGTVLRNIEGGRWKEPTPIQMQSLPSLMDRRDVMGCAPTGSGKTGAFVLPAIALAKCDEGVYYGKQRAGEGEGGEGKNGKKKKGKKQEAAKSDGQDLQGHVRTILLAPSRELASQLHREVLRLSSNMPGKFHAAMLSKSNAGLASSNRLGGKMGLDCLVATPLRLVECLERGMKLRGVRLVVLDEADRLLDASDGRGGESKKKGKDEKKKGKGDESDSDSDSESEEEEEEEEEQQPQQQSGSSQSRTFLQQIDSILADLPASTTRALFSATLGPSVRHLSESILRSPVDITTGIHAGTGGNSAAGGASEHIKQELKFVGREEGKLLAIRQLVAEGITPPVLIFMQSKERAQALFGELLYDGIRVDVIHAGRSAAARESSVQKFRRGETWVLICTDLVARGVDFKAVNLVINYDLPTEGVTYVHRIGRTGRAGREGRAITFFTEADFDNLRTIANVVRLSGCDVPEWMLTMKRGGGGGGGGGGSRGGNRSGGAGRGKKKSLVPMKRADIDTTPRYDKRKKRKRSGGKRGDKGSD